MIFAGVVKYTDIITSVGYEPETSVPKFTDSVAPVLGFLQMWTSSLPLFLCLLYPGGKVLVRVSSMVRFGLVVFYSISTLEEYSVPNPVYTYDFKVNILLVNLF